MEDNKENSQPENLNLDVKFRPIGSGMYYVTEKDVEHIVRAFQMLSKLLDERKEDEPKSRLILPNKELIK